MHFSEFFHQENENKGICSHVMLEASKARVNAWFPAGVATF